MDLKRREIKFQIPMRLVDPICQYLESFCDMDYHSSIRPNGFYTINSLYLDNDMMLLLEKKRQNVPRRFSMRIRSYGDEPKFPAYMEIKYKNDQMVNKRRAPITSEDTLRIFAEGRGQDANPDFDNEFMQKAYFQILSLGLKPKMMTQYKRRAFMGRFEPYSRVTFDRSLRCYEEPTYGIFPKDMNFRSYDHEDMYLSPQSNVILELKCELKVPAWMKALISRFELRQSQFSKFESSWDFLNDDQYPHELFEMISAR